MNITPERPLAPSHALLAPRPAAPSLAKAFVIISDRVNETKENSIMKTEAKAYHIPVEIKELSEEGQLEGWAAVFGNVDLGGDVIEPGAFTKTIKERGSEVLICAQHNTDWPLGTCEIQERPKGLWMKGKLELELGRAKEIYLMLKKKLVRGLSIGFQSIPSKTSIENGIRHLKEVKLYEISVVTLPMNELALIENVKADAPAILTAERKMDFLTALEREREWSLMQLMPSALWSSLDSILWDHNLSDEEQYSQSDIALNQFHQQYLEWLPQMQALLRPADKASLIAEIKAGRRLSEATRKTIQSVIADWQQAVTSLQALLDEGEIAEEEAAKTQSNVPDSLHPLLLKTFDHLVQEALKV